MSAPVDVYFDPASNGHRRNRLFDLASTPYAGDQIVAPYVVAKKRLEALGYRVQTADMLPERPNGRINLVISFGTPDRLIAFSVWRYRRLARRPDVVLSAFLAMECPVVEPTMFAALPALSRMFRRILSWSDTAALQRFTGSPVAVEHFSWPQSFDAVHQELWARGDRKFLLMMNTNKLPRLYVNELYTARLKAVEFFHRFGEVDLYGRGWNRPPARVGKTWTPGIMRRMGTALWRLRQRIVPDPVYVAAAGANRGPAKSKSETMSQYRFALCFENSVLKGWMTEKLFDCFFCGTIPVYWGAPDILDWVPAECFIDMRQFRDFAELRSFLHGLRPADEQRYRDAGRAYVESDRFSSFRGEAFADLMEKIVAADAGALTPGVASRG